jgi:hypothetical protein
MIIKANEAAGSPSSPAMEFGLFRKDHEKGLFFDPTHDSAPSRGGEIRRKWVVCRRFAPAHNPFLTEIPNRGGEH